MANSSGVQCIRHLKGFADSNDAIQSIAVEAEYTVSTTNRDFFLVHVHLKKKKKKSVFGLMQRLLMMKLKWVAPAPQSPYLHGFFITGHFMVFDP